MLDTKHAETALELLPAIKGMLIKMGLPMDQVEDHLHDAWVHLSTYALPRWDGKGSLRTFATQAVKGRVINSLKARDNRKVSRASLPVEGEMGTKQTDFILTSSNACERLEASDMLARVMGYLTSTEARVLAAYREHGTWDAAAKAAGVSPATATRARQSIRAKLEAL